LIDLGAHRVLALPAAIFGQALKARLPERGPYDNRRQIKIFNRLGDLLLTPPPRAGRNHGADDEAEQESDRSGGLQ
jgi:hypothetical protein